MISLHLYFSLLDRTVPDWTFVQLAKHVPGAFINCQIRHKHLVPRENPRSKERNVVMPNIGSRTFLFPVLAAALLTVGCATKEEVEHAQATANTALSTAQQAGQAAQQAQQAAATAQQTADQARSEVSALSQKVDALAQMRARGPRD